MDWSYLSGFFDGEGSINIRNGFRQNGKTHKSVQLILAQVFYQADVLEKIRDFLLNEAIHSSVHIRQPKLVISQLHAMHILSVSRYSDVWKMLEKMLPLLIVKRQKAIEALEFLREHDWRPSSRRIEIGEKIVKLYQRGESMPTIAKEFGYSIGSVWNILHRNRIPSRPPGPMKQSHL